jgi:hypothetical protein
VNRAVGSIESTVRVDPKPKNSKRTWSFFVAPRTVDLSNLGCGEIVGFLGKGE